MKRDKVVIGLGYGDCGKGLATSFLSSQSNNPLIVRFNGGSQAGHTIVHNGNRHVFSNFGSGTLQGVPTYWSEFCTFCPVGVLNEYNALKSIKGIEPKLYVNPLCPVTTPYDKEFNCFLEKANRNGSVGVGFGSTLQRQEDYYKLFVQDLFFEDVLVQKMKHICNYYSKKMSIQSCYLDNILNIDINNFLEIVRKVKDIIVLDNGDIARRYDLIFEGAQGILLDQDFGFFPNVTRSNTTSKNAIKLYKDIHGVSDEAFKFKRDNDLEVYYVTRTYQTRHGNGFMTNEHLADKLELKNNENETNVTNEFQGIFRKTVLDIDLLKYALTCDSNFSSGLKKNLVITCIDQTGETIPVTINKVLKYINVEDLPRYLGVKFETIYLSRGDSYNKMSIIYGYNERALTKA